MTCIKNLRPAKGCYNSCKSKVICFKCRQRKICYRFCFFQPSSILLMFLILAWTHTRYYKKNTFEYCHAISIVSCAYNVLVYDISIFEGCNKIWHTRRN